jgi:hypothetical protein
MSIVVTGVTMGTYVVWAEPGRIVPIVATGVTEGKYMVATTEDDWEQISDELSAGGRQTPVPTSV